jgi:urea transport system substrate-binding protein
MSGADGVVAPSVVQEAQLAVDEINAAAVCSATCFSSNWPTTLCGAAGAKKAFDSFILPDEG